MVTEDRVVDRRLRSEVGLAGLGGRRELVDRLPGALQRIGGGHYVAGAPERKETDGSLRQVRLLLQRVYLLLERCHTSHERGGWRRGSVRGWLLRYERRSSGCPARKGYEQPDAGHDQRRPRQ